MGFSIFAFEYGRAESLFCLLKLSGNRFKNHDISLEPSRINMSSMDYSAGVITIELVFFLI